MILQVWWPRVSNGLYRRRYTVSDIVDLDIFPSGRVEATLDRVNPDGSPTRIAWGADTLAGLQGHYQVIRDHAGWPRAINLDVDGTPGDGEDGNWPDDEPPEGQRDVWMKEWWDANFSHD